MAISALAPEWRISHWENTPQPLSLRALRGRVVLALAFQMLCPGCVSQGLPQAQRARAAFPESDLAVIGLHTVFEHHAAQGSPQALHAFLHEYRIAFPVGIDEQNPRGGVPLTMGMYGMRGTPTVLLIDRAGALQWHQFGHVEDMQLGAAIATLAGRRANAAEAATPTAPGCSADACVLPD